MRSLARRTSRSILTPGAGGNYRGPGPCRRMKRARNWPRPIERRRGWAITVRAAMLAATLCVAAPGVSMKTIAAPARKELNNLIDRLAAALDLNAEPGRSSIGGICAGRTCSALAVDEWWNQEARLLYDLQKACVNYEREIYSVGVIEWLLEFCHRPLRRPQPNQRIALICKSLRTREASAFRAFASTRAIASN